MTNQGLQQESIRAVTGTALTYEGDWHALFDMAGIAAGTFNGRLLAWINDRLGTTYANLPGAMQAFAESQGAYNWSSMGTFDAAGNRSYDFTAATLPAGATLERASTGTRFNASGVLVSAAIDAARFDYDPATLDLLGLLLEPQRTNLVANSATLTGYGTSVASWTGTNATTAPDGSSDADELTDAVSGGSTFHGFNITAALGAGTKGCASVYAKKKGTFNGPGFLLNSVGSGNPSAGVNLDTGAWSNSGFESTFYEVINSGWKRIAVVQDPMTGNGPNQWTYLMGGFGTGNASWDMYFWGAQIEDGAFPSSYIPTGGSSATRSADVLTLALPDGDWSLSVVTPNGTFASAAPVTAAGGAGYEFAWADLAGATGQRHVLSITATPA